MKKRITVLLVLMTAFMLGCSSYGKITVENDEFKGATTVLMDYQYKPTNWKGPASYLTITYFRMIKDGQKQAIEMSFNLIAQDGVSALQQKAFIKAGEKKSELIIAGMLIESKSRTDVNTSVESKGGGRSFAGVGNSANASVKTRTSSHTYTWKELKGKMIMTKEIEESILKNKKVMMRFYVDNKPVTYIIEEDALKKLKAYLRHDGTIKK